MVAFSWNNIVAWRKCVSYVTVARVPNNDKENDDDTYSYEYNDNDNNYFDNKTTNLTMDNYYDYITTTNTITNN